MPVRFTDAVDKKSRLLGVFKHARGILRGWRLREAEETRIADIEASEVVLRKQPLSLNIKLMTATKDLALTGGKPIYVLKLQVRPWSLDRAGDVKVTRIGFPIVPDFGGTAPSNAALGRAGT